jgi:putative DNA primase/helicase
MHEHMTPDEALRYQPQAPIEDWPELQPLETENADAEGFPFDAMGEICGEAARAIAEEVQAPDAMAGGSVLAAASLAVCPLADVALPHNQQVPTALYIVTGGSSGDRKSATDSVASYEIEEQRKRQARKHVEDMQRWECENADRKKSDQTRPPTPQVATVSNGTTEGFVRLLKNQPAVGVFSSEGGEIFGGHSMRDERRAAGLSFLLKLWSGETVDALRGGEGLSVLLNRRLVMHAMVQPILLQQLLADPLAHGQGLLARCLISMPPTRAGTRLYRQVDPRKNPAVIRFGERIRALLDTPATVWPNGDGYELKPYVMHMEPDAVVAWVDFFDQIELAQAPGGELADARAFASKAAEQAARIAGVIAVIEGHNSIKLDDVVGGIRIATYYTNQHLKLTGTGKTNKRINHMQMLVDWMREHGPHVVQTAILQSSPRPIRALKAQGIKALLTELATRGYVREVTHGIWEVRHVQD